MSGIEILGPSALREMHERDERNGVDPHAIPRGAPLALSPPPRFEFPEVDWHQENLARERAARGPREPDPALHAEDEEVRPARPKARRWTGEQVVSDRGTAA